MSELEYTNPDGVDNDVLDLTKPLGGQCFVGAFTDDGITFAPESSLDAVVHLTQDNPEIHGGAVFGQIDCCERCGDFYDIGDWPFCPHGRTLAYKPFIPYFDFALGVQVNSHAERWRHMRNLHVDYRDKMSAGDLSARKDRVHERRKEEAR